jgi:hypothetical protein
MSIGCLLCDREIQPFPPLVPNARGFDRALLCRWHFRDSLDPEWFTMGAAAYWARLDKLNLLLEGQPILSLWQTPEIVSFLLEFASGVLLLYPQNESALFSFVPRALLYPGRPSGLLQPQDASLSQRLLRQTFSSLQFATDGEGFPDEKALTLTLGNSTSLYIQATGKRVYGSNPEDVCEIMFS